MTTRVEPVLEVLVAVVAPDWLAMFDQTLSSNEEDELWGWEEFFQQIGQFMRECERKFSEQYAEYVVERLQLCVRSCCSLLDHFNDFTAETEHHTTEHREIVLMYKDNVVKLIDCLRELSKEWVRLKDNVMAIQVSSAYCAPVIGNSGRGRPSFEVSFDQIDYLRSLSFSWTGIASLLGISRMTWYRRRRMFGLANGGTTLDDDSLKRLLTKLRRHYPDIGEKMVTGQLRSLGYQVSRDRVRVGIRQTDPIDTALRWQGVKTSRRRYCVP